MTDDALSSKFGESSNILMMLPYFVPQYGGAELQAYQLAQWINDKRTFKVSIATLYGRELPRAEILHGVPIYRFGSKHFDYFSGYEELGEFIYKTGHNYTGIHQHIIYGADPDAQLRIGEIARKLGLWQILKITSSEKVNLIKNEYSYSTASLKKANAIVSLNSGISQELLSAGVDSRKIVQIPNGVDSKKFFPVQDIQRKNFIRNKLGLPLDKILFIFVGRIVNKKGVDVLLKAWAIHEVVMKDTILLIIGDDDADIKKIQSGRNSPCYKECLKLSDELQIKRILWLGPKDHSNDLPTYYQASDCLILPSRNEGCPNVILEAMSVGIPVIGTRIPGILDLVEDNDEGILVEVDQVDELAKAISSIARKRELREQMAVNARRKILSGYDLESIARKYLDLYKRLNDVTR
jgi:glycosyltransferase involved in cell wall biosynthesis